MRRTLILTLMVLACALALCAVSQAALNRAVDAALDIERKAVSAAGAGRLDDAEAMASKLEEQWKDQAHLLELTVSHDALRDAAALIAEARIRLRYGDAEDFLCAMSAVETRLARLRDEEALRWENLY